jgi:hypothetical protein
VRELPLFGLLFGAPVDEVAGVEGDAEEVGGDEAELGGAHANDTDDGAIERGDDPALPELLADQDGSEHGQNAREIIQSNHVEHVQHTEQVNRNKKWRTELPKCSRLYDSLFLDGRADCAADADILGAFEAAHTLVCER